MHLPLGDADVAATGRTLDFFQERLAHGPDDPHWKPLDMTAVLDDPPVPILHLDGWYDFHRVPCFEDFERLNASDVVRRLVLGPWTHGGVDDRLQGILRVTDPALGKEGVPVRVDLGPIARDTVIGQDGCLLSRERPA
jgi:predicted acyl esterase